MLGTGYSVTDALCMFSPRDDCFDTANAYLQLDMLVLSLNMQIDALCVHIGPNYGCSVQGTVLRTLQDVTQ